MPRVLVAHQPAYLPWPGYFSRLHDVPELILLDHVSYSSRGWQNRNFVQDARGQRLRLTVPVSARLGQPIHDVCVADQRFRPRHWRALSETYARSAYWNCWEAPLGAIYSRTWDSLADLNEKLIRLLLDGLGIRVTVRHSSSLLPSGTKTEMLANLAAQTGAQILRIGQGAAAYIDASLLAARGISVQVAAFDYPPRLTPAGGPVSVLDLLLRHGPAARRILGQGASIRTLDTL